MIGDTGDRFLRKQSVRLEVMHRHEKLAPESGVVNLGLLRQFLQPVSGA